jgi:hypothetical protein
MRYQRAIIWVAIGIQITPIAVVIVFIFAGAGHGTNLPAKLIFPYAMLTMSPDRGITALNAAVALAQFPLYGVIGAAGEMVGRWWLPAIFLLLVHVSFVVLCLPVQI